MKRNNIDRILDSNEQGFEDAVNASDEARELVRSLLHTIADLEAELERQ